MGVEMDLRSSAPADCTKAELDAFFNHVKKGGQVSTAGLKLGVKRAQRLLFLYHGPMLAGTSAIKRPLPAYKKNVFRSAGVPDLEQEYKFELGYVVVATAYQEQKLSRDLVKAALDDYTTTPIFATSRTDKDRMHRTLKRFCFVQVGTPYPSKLEGCELLLFIRRVCQ